MATDHAQASQQGDEEGPSDPAARAKFNNRKAQKRYRERQRVLIAGYQRTLEELTKKLDKLSKEKAKPESRTTRSQEESRTREQPLQPAALVEAPASLEAKLEAFSSYVLSFLKLIGIRKGLPATLTLDYLHGLTDPQGAHYKQLFMQELSRCMNEGGDIVGTPAYNRMVELIEGKFKVQMGWAAVDAKMSRTIEFSLKTQPWPRSRWQDVLRAMALSAEQIVQLLQARARLLAETQAIVAERKRILAVLQDASPDLSEDSSNAASFVHAYEASNELAASLDAEHRAHIRFVAACYSEIISPLQQARGNLAAAPWLLDLLAICNTLAGEVNQPPAEAAAALSLFDPEPLSPPPPAASLPEGPLLPVASPYILEPPLRSLPDLSGGVSVRRTVLENPLESCPSSTRRPAITTALACTACSTPRVAGESARKMHPCHVCNDERPLLSCLQT